MKRVETMYKRPTSPNVFYPKEHQTQANTPKSNNKQNTERIVGHVSSMARLINTAAHRHDLPRPSPRQYGGREYWLLAISASMLGVSELLFGSWGFTALGVGICRVFCISQLACCCCLWKLEVLRLLFVDLVF